jgi:hypothetical protein
MLEALMMRKTSGHRAKAFDDFIWWLILQLDV